MESENWINETLESTKGMQRAEPNPFLFEKIAGRIQNEKVKPVKVPVARWAFAASAAVLICINIISISVSSQAKDSASEKDQISELANELGYKTNYNY